MPLRTSILPRQGQLSTCQRFTSSPSERSEWDGSPGPSLEECKSLSSPQANSQRNPELEEVSSGAYVSPVPGLVAAGLVVPPHEDPFHGPTEEEWIRDRREYARWRGQWDVEAFWPSDEQLRARVAGRAPQALGLSLCSYLTAGERGERCTNLVRFAVDGSLVESRPLGCSVHRGGPGGKRGRITRFSYHSRSRMMRHLARYKRKKMARSIFITLTYPSIYPSNHDAKRQLMNFLKRLMRKYPDAGITWRMEYQSKNFAETGRLAPHFHLIVLGPRFIPHQWVAQAWHEIVDWEDRFPEHLRAGTETRRVRDYAQAVYYASKYVAKMDDICLEDTLGSVPPGAIDADPRNVPGLEDAPASSGASEASMGRLWGHYGRWRDYQAEIVELAFTRAAAARVARTFDGLVRSVSKGRGRRRKRRQVLGKCVNWYADVAQIFGRLPELVGTVGRVSAAVAAAARPGGRGRGAPRTHRSSAWAT